MSACKHMAGSTTPPSTDLPVHRIAVAYSGGRDSTALLHATARMARELGGIEVLALHVHHGLNQQADSWLAHARQQCAGWADAGLPVHLRWRELRLRPVAGDSVEAVARDARYQALADMARETGCDTVLLAHHRQDQAETFLLQALRGAGAAGLAAMPAAAVRGGLNWRRPWLDHPRAAIEAYVAHHGLQYIEDGSNTDQCLARNRLRLAVWPALAGSFAQAEPGLAQAASHQADVLACLEDWLAGALPRVIRQAGEGAHARPGLCVEAWRSWPSGPRRELLRAWFRAEAGQGLPYSWVVRLAREALPGLPRRWPVNLRLEGGSEGGVLRGEVVLYRGLMSWRPADASRHDGQGWPSAGQAVELSISAPGRVSVPQAGGVLVITPVARGGVSWARLVRCQLRPRSGGEQFQVAARRPARSLKKQFQMLGVPLWERQGPLLWSGGELVYVPGLGIDARVQAADGEPQAALHWESI